MVKISLLGVIKDTIVQGYPLLESLLCVLPICDEVLVSDGGSKDGTLEMLYRFKDEFPDKNVKIYQIPDYKSERWDCCSDAMNCLIGQATGDWLFSSHADEIIHEEDVPALESAIESEREAACFRQPRREFSKMWMGLTKYEYGVVRAAINYPGVAQNWNMYGGDEYIQRGIRGTLQPEKPLDITIYHAYVMFPLNTIEKRRRDAEFLAPNDKMRPATYEDALKRRETIENTPIPNIAEIYHRTPAICHGLTQMRAYEVREELFDRDWLRETTGINYG